MAATSTAGCCGRRRCVGGRGLRSGGDSAAGRASLRFGAINQADDAPGPAINGQATAAGKTSSWRQTRQEEEQQEEERREERRRAGIQQKWASARKGGGGGWGEVEEQKGRLGQAELRW